MIAIRMKKFYKKTRRRVCVDGKTPVGFDKKKLECFICPQHGHFSRECYSKRGLHDGKKKRDSFYQHQEAGKQEKNQMGLLTMDDGLSIGDNILKLKRQIMHLWLSAQVMRDLKSLHPMYQMIDLGIIQPVRSNDSTGSMEAHLNILFDPESEFSVPP
ncbi:ribonuclease H-like domain-containing protein [Tanacetum coccineum]